MPWLETSPMTERMQLVEYQRGLVPLAELARRAGVSRKTAYTWTARFESAGALGLQDQSRRPRTCGHATAPAAIEAVLALRRRHPTWGPKKLLHVLRQRHPEVAWPARSTAADVLARHGLVVSPRRVRRPGHPGRPRTPMTAPNEIWTIDFKGHCWAANTSAFTRSTTGSGTCTSDRCAWAALTNATAGSKMRSVANVGDNCHPCLQTEVLPVSPAVHVPSCCTPRVVQECLELF